MPVVRCPSCGGRPPYCGRCGHSGTIWQEGAGMSSHSKGQPIHGEFCATHLNFVVACSDDQIAGAVSQLLPYDLARLRRIVSRAREQEPEQKESG